jgi:16S rRNA (guanine966-N2)-methyltransferase
MADIKEARCLDAFAGSGALGLEAFSRGAAKITLIEQSPVAHAHLLKTITEFKSAKLHLVKTDVLLYLQNTKETFDVIFLDPPFVAHLIPQCLDILATNPCLITGGLVYLESDCAIEVDEVVWEQLKLKQAGNVVYGLFKKR